MSSGVHRTAIFAVFVAAGLSCAGPLAQCSSSDAARHSPVTPPHALRLRVVAPRLRGGSATDCGDEEGSVTDGPTEYGMDKHARNEVAHLSCAAPFCLPIS